MFSHVKANLALLAGTMFLGSVAYPAVVYAIGQGLFPTTANGSLIVGADGKPVGSRLIAQEFKEAKYFHPRPSAAGYNGGASSGSNYGANNPKLKARVEDQLKAEYDGAVKVPADAVTAGGSGLDPHISAKAAYAQADRVAAARGQGAADLRQMIDRLAFTPLAGLSGEPIVNVLELNRELDGLGRGEN